MRQPKSRRFRLHLSTALVLLLVASLLLGLNAIPRPKKVGTSRMRVEISQFQFIEEVRVIEVNYYGWPFSYTVDDLYFKVPLSDPVSAHLVYIVADTVLAFGVLAFTWWLLEIRLRRRPPGTKGPV